MLPFFSKLTFLQPGFEKNSIEIRIDSAINTNYSRKLKKSLNKV